MASGGCGRSGGPSPPGRHPRDAAWHRAARGIPRSIGSPQRLGGVAHRRRAAHGAVRSLLAPARALPQRLLRPIERLLRDSGANISFAPADFRRFAPILAATAPRVMCTAAAPPDDDGWCSLSLHAGASVDELHRAGADADRLLVVEVSGRYPRTRGLSPLYDHAVHVDEIDVLV